MEGEHIFDPEALEASQEEQGEGNLEVNLRPTSLGEFVGQRRVVEDLQITLTAARQRGEAPDHVLFSGPPGLGKTSLARIVATELSTRLISTSGPALEKPRDLVGLLTQLEAGDVFFIDEVHRVPKAVEEYLYTAMEDGQVDLTLDSGPHARMVTLRLEPFTLVGATTREGLLTAPFRARFGLLHRLDPYPVEDLVTIVERLAGLLGVELTSTSAQLLAERSRGTPRIVGRLLRRTRDLAQVRGTSPVDESLTRESLTRLGIDENGLEEMDRRILRCLAENGGGPLALKTIAAVVSESEDTLEDVYEPHLLRSGLLRKTPRGRMLSPAGAQLLGVRAPGEDGSRSLFD
ncbi:MAG: Holliday junction branch migration DNA helicase RuvB [Planctomycetota bacterium]|nr:Holliday junction branch migration DNA helicase RuvB [Planctomycetota bacterium]